MKKIISLTMAVLLVMSLFAGCGSSSSKASDTVSESTSADSSETSTASSESSAVAEDPATFRIAGLKGPTSIGMVKLMEDAQAGTTENEYQFTMAGAADEITPLFIKGDLDIISGPVNLASVLYNKTDGAVRFLAVNTLGVLYIVQKGGDEITSLADLKGKTIYATGKGSTPEYSLRYLLTENGLNPDTDVTIEWKTEPTEVVALMAQDETAIAMMPQPYVTVAQTKIETLSVALSLTEEWEKLDNDTALITAGIFVRAEFAEKYPQQLAKFLEEYEASTKFVNEDVETAATLCEKYDIVNAAVAKKAIPFCNITCKTGADMKTMTSGYLSVLFDQEPTSVGGALPKDDFYYDAK